MGCIIAALVYTQGSPQPLQGTLSTCLSGFCACSVKASTASVHTQWAPHRLWGTLTGHLSGLCTHSVHASAALMHTQSASTFLEILEDFRRILEEDFRSLNSLIECLGYPMAAFAYTHLAPQQLLGMLSVCQSFVTPLILTKSNDSFSKNLQWAIGNYKSERNLKSATEKVSFFIIVFL